MKDTFRKRKAGWCCLWKGLDANYIHTTVVQCILFDTSAKLTMHAFTSNLDPKILVVLPFLWLPFLTVLGQLLHRLTESREQDITVISIVGYCMGSHVCWWNDRLILLEVLFSLTHEYRAHSHRSSLLQRALLISCNSMSQPCDYRVIAGMAEWVCKGGVELWSQGTFGSHIQQFCTQVHDCQPRSQWAFCH